MSRLFIPATVVSLEAETRRCGTATLAAPLGCTSCRSGNRPNLPDRGRCRQGIAPDHNRFAADFRDGGRKLAVRNRHRELANSIRNHITRSRTGCFATGQTVVLDADTITYADFASISGSIVKIDPATATRPPGPVTVTVTV